MKSLPIFVQMLNKESDTTVKSTARGQSLNEDLTLAVVGSLAKSKIKLYYSSGARVIPLCNATTYDTKISAAGAG